MFLPCARCGGASHPALAHLTGLTQSLCWDCSQDSIVKRLAYEQREKKRELALTLAVWDLACSYIEEQTDESTTTFGLVDHTPIPPP